MKKRIMTGLMLVCLLNILPAEEKIRNISTAEFLANFDETWDLKIEDVFLYPFHPAILMEIRATVNTNNRFSRYMLQPGLVAVFSPGFYLEFVYGLALDDSTNLSQEGFFELTYETERFIFAGGGKFGYFHSDNTWFAIPSVYGMVKIIDPWAVRLKYLVSFNSAEEVTHGLNMENRFYWTKAVETDLVTAGSWLVEPRTWFTWEAGARVVFNITDDIALKYYIGMLGNEEEPTGILNILTLDVKWAGKQKTEVER
jgi:hypothetical protein